MMRGKGDAAIYGSRCTRRRVLPRFSLSEGVKGLRPARFVLLDSVYNGGAQPVGVATRSRGFGGMEIGSVLQFRPAVYMSTPGLGFTGDKIMSIFKLKGRKALSCAPSLQSVEPVAGGFGPVARV